MSTLERLRSTESVSYSLEDGKVSGNIHKSDILEAQTNVNITLDNYPSLYGQFLTTTINPHSASIINQIHVSIADVLKEGTRFNEETINTLKRFWHQGGFSEKEINLWSNLELMDRYQNNALLHKMIFVNGLRSNKAFLIYNQIAEGLL
ncbi:hypothetical protein ABLB84_07710 [Xenorhabdus szentirmaii]|uniref:hypothetical protein n=1 Tax=Xenorhabdus szentirmaii TaxID=290112 RepID=UPI0032B858F3